MHDDVLKQLYEPFNLKARQGVGNQTFYYAPSDDVINRMNTVFKGNWSTIVTCVERFEDNVLIRVLVSAKDMDSGEQFSHEGFASQQIARFNSGPKQGQLIDLGNSYKSAMSKAIKNAVSKWGVGLYIDKGKASTNTISSSIPNTNPVIMNTPNVSPASTAKPADSSLGPPTGMLMGPPTGSTTNTSPVNIPSQETSDTVFNNDNIVSNNNTGPPVESFVNSTAEENNYISGVQKQAIKHILDLNSMQYDVLSKNALQIDNVPEIDKLLYNQAIKIIQYGNNLSTATS